MALDIIGKKIETVNQFIYQFIKLTEAARSRNIKLNGDLWELKQRWGYKIPQYFRELGQRFLYKVRLIGN